MARQQRPSSEGPLPVKGHLFSGGGPFTCDGTARESQPQRSPGREDQTAAEEMPFAGELSLNQLACMAGPASAAGQKRWMNTRTSSDV